MADKKEYATRFGMGLLALLFLITSIGFSILVVWQVREQRKKEAIQTAATAAIKKSTTQPITKQGDKKLEGTQLENFTPSDSPVTQLKIEDTIIGTGEEVKSGETITAHYTGALVKSGIIFQSSKDTGKTFTSPLSGLIEGWQKGIPGMKVGGTRRLIIPAAQAYGSNAQGGIPANSDLVFDIELAAVSK